LQSPLLWCRGCPCWDWRLLCTFCWALNPSYRLPWPLYRCRVLSQPADNCYSDCVWGFNAYCGGKGLYSEQSSQIWKSPCERVLFWGFFDLFCLVVLFPKPIDLVAWKFLHSWHKISCVDPWTEPLTEHNIQDLFLLWWCVIFKGKVDTRYAFYLLFLVFISEFTLRLFYWLSSV
jgi:hypothetical protein